MEDRDSTHMFMSTLATRFWPTFSTLLASDNVPCTSQKDFDGAWHAGYRRGLGLATACGWEAGGITSRLTDFKRESFSKGLYADEREDNWISYLQLPLARRGYPPACCREESPCEFQYSKTGHEALLGVPLCRVF